MRFGRFFFSGVAIACIFFFHTAETRASEYFAGDFLSLGAEARALGMGGAYVSIVDDAASTYYNPAGLTGVKTREAGLMHSEEFNGLEGYNSISYAAPLSKTEAVGVTLLHLGVGGINVTKLMDPSQALGDSNRVEVAYKTDSADYALMFGGGKKLRDDLSVGVAVKMIRRSVGKDTAFGYGIDLGVQYRLNDAVRFGASFRDVTGTAVVWDVVSDANDHKTHDRIAPTLDAGAACSGELPWFGGNYTIAASMLFFGDSPKIKGINTMHLGGEYRIADVVAIRAGLSEGSGTFGIGLSRLPLLASTGLDYAFLSHAELDTTHRISMNVRF